MSAPTSAAIVHFYRATVMHSDLWRKRLDITTNWSVVTTAGIITFAFSEPSHPPISILLAYPFTCLFIMMESRRYQMYDLWRHRVRLLNRFVVAPALSGEPQLEPERIERELARLAEALGTAIPRLRLRDAVGYRIRRNYGLLFGAILTMWLLKLFAHPAPASSLWELIERGRLGPLSGWATLSLALAFCLAAFVLGARAPTEKMRDWVELPSPWDRVLHPNRPGRELTLCEREASNRREGDPL